ncbi:MAG: DUF4393 domain-containing protein [Clostridia bacterium]|nr:DUF4393 domain-containing protein [Clostridia bacterium]
MPNIEIPDIIKSASDAAQDNLPATMQQTDGALSTVVGFFNNVVLYPVKKANLTFRYKLEAFEDDLKEKTKHIPPENLQIPPTMIAGPALEALRYTYDEKELREMYENLLASAMDSRLVSQAHPSFVDTIKQMSPLDARLIEIIASNRQFACANIQFSIVNEGTYYVKGMPNYFVEELANFSDPFDVSTSLHNLVRLGLIDISEATLNNYNYQSLKTHPYVLSQLEVFKQFGKKIEVKLNELVIRINNYGECFAQVCLEKEKNNAD